MTDETIPPAGYITITPDPYVRGVILGAANLGGTIPPEYSPEEAAACRRGHAEGQASIAPVVHYGLGERACGARGEPSTLKLADVTCASCLGALPC